MKSKAEQIYKAVVEGDSYKGSKKECIEIIEKIINSPEPASKNAQADISRSGSNERGILINDFLVWMGKEKLMGSSVSARKNLIEEFEKSFNSR